MPETIDNTISDNSVEIPHGVEEDDMGGGCWQQDEIAQAMWDNYQSVLVQRINDGEDEDEDDDSDNDDDDDEDDDK